MVRFQGFGNMEHFITIAPYQMLSLRVRVVAPDKVKSMGQIEQFVIQTNSVKLNYLKRCLII